MDFSYIIISYKKTNFNKGDENKMAVYQDFKNETDRKNKKPVKTKDGRSWYFRAYKNGKQYESKKYLTKQQAIDEEAIFILKRDNPTNKLFSVVAKDYFNEMYKKRKESTVYCYENIYNKNILPYFGDLSLNNINIQVVREWHNKMDRTKLKTSYKNKLNTILKAILNHAMKNYGLEKNYADIFGNFENVNENIVKDDEKIRYINFEDFNKFMSVIEDNLWKTFFTTLYYTGMRKGEIQALTWNDIDFNTNVITVNKTLSTKTSSDIGYKITNTKNYINRKVSMSSTLKETLLSYKNQVKKYTDFSEDWFVFGNSRFLPHITIDRHKHYYFEQYNKDKNDEEKIHEITIHEFRHSHVSLLINEYVKTSKEKNMKIDTAKFFLIMSNRMGHTIQVMQETYMHLFPTIQDEIVDLLDNL